MKCPSCKREIKYVIEYSKTAQRRYFNSAGKLEGFGIVEVLDVDSWECPVCSQIFEFDELEEGENRRVKVTT